MNRDDYVALAARGLAMPIGAHLVLHEQPDPDAVTVDGRRLGEVVAATARRFGTPLAVPLMDLTVEKAALLGAHDVIMRKVEAMLDAGPGRRGGHAGPA